MAFEVPYFSKSDLTAAAESFTNKYNPDRSVPVPIELILESEFGIDIVPAPGLDNFDVVAFLSQDQTEIWVDEFVFEKRENRYRFSLAHELAHHILHSQLWSQFRFQDVASWVRDIRNLLSERDYGILEWQANFFAGMVLVPPRELSVAFDQATEQCRTIGVSPDEDAAREIIAEHIGRRFVVSPDVVRRRLEHEQL